LSREATSILPRTTRVEASTVANAARAESHQNGHLCLQGVHLARFPSAPRTTAGICNFCLVGVAASAMLS
jgi:hypothetical protein